MLKKIIENIDEGKAESSVTKSLENALNEIDRSIKIATKNLPSGARLKTELDKAADIIQEEIMYVSKGEYS